MVVRPQPLQRGLRDRLPQQAPVREAGQPDAWLAGDFGARGDPVLGLELLAVRLAAEVRNARSSAVEAVLRLVAAQFDRLHSCASWPGSHSVTGATAALRCDCCAASSIAWV